MSDKSYSYSHTCTYCEVQDLSETMKVSLTAVFVTEIARVLQVEGKHNKKILLHFKM